MLALPFPEVPVSARRPSVRWWWWLLVPVVLMGVAWVALAVLLPSVLALTRSRRRTLGTAGAGEAVR